MKKSILSIIMLISLVSCSSTNTDNSKLKIACSFAPIYDLAYRIAGDNAEIINICGNNEPHDFSPNDASIVASVEKCDVLLGYDNHVDEWAKKLNADKFYNITTSVNFENDDPHAWLSIKESKTMLKTVYEKIVELDKDNKDVYLANYSKALAEFDELDAKYTSGLASCKDKYLVTSHAAFYYLARDYNLNQLGLKDVAGHEPTSADFKKVINTIKENNVSTIFVEELDETSSVQTVIDELAKEDYSVTLKELSTYEAISQEDYFKGFDYISVMEENLNTLKESL
jgi:zinc transport system substrate-binding protein